MALQLLIATRNAGKTREFEHLLRHLFPEGLEAVDLAHWPEPLPEVVEDGSTFAHNALKKAWEISQATGVTTLADDSGLEVDALDGRPGVYSARFAGPDADDAANNRMLVRALRDVPPDERGARYVAVIALCLAHDPIGDQLGARFSDPIATADRFHDIPEATPTRVGDRILLWVRDECTGIIVDEPRGEGGFGYDPHFFVPSLGRRVAELTRDEKATISHRARALRALRTHLDR